MIEMLKKKCINTKEKNKKRIISAGFCIAFVASVIMCDFGNVAKVDARDSMIDPLVQVFATKEQLMSSFTTDGSGRIIKNNTHQEHNDGIWYLGRLYFGKNDKGKDQAWYITGVDEDNPGDNIVLFAIDPILLKQKFCSRNLFDENGKRIYNIYDDDGYVDGYDTITDETIMVFANHYGASGPMSINSAN